MQPFQLPPGARSQFTAAINRGLPTFLPVRANPNSTYQNPYAGQANPQTGNFGMGGGGANRYDFTQAGSGLHSIGIDRSSPSAINDAIRWYQSQDPGTRAEIGRLAGRRVNDPVGLLDAIDARQRDVARKIQKENGFFDSTFGKILGAALPIAAGFIPGIGTAAQIGLGAAMGGAGGGVKGALLGGIGSAIVPSIKFPGISTALKAPVQAATSVARQFANPVTASRQLASMGIGRMNNGRD